MMLQRYESTYESKIKNGFIKKSEWQLLQDATIKYLTAAGFDDKVKAVTIMHFEKEAVNLPQ